MFQPRRSECGGVLSINVRVNKPRQLAIEGASGVAGFLAGELPPDGAPIAPFDCIEWLKRLSNESGPDFLKRARAQAESVEACLGLAFTNNGSIGRRRPGGRVPWYLLVC